MAHSKTATGWDKLVYYDEQNEPCIDLTIDAVKRQFLVRDVVCLFYHGPRPYPYSVSHVIDSLNPCTPDNVGWLSQGPDAHRNNAPESVEIGSPEAQKFKRPLKRAKKVMKWDHLSFVNDDGALYLGGTYQGEWKRFLLEEYLSESYQGPWPVQDSYAFIIDLSKGCALENLGWMTQNPEYRTVKIG
jgi:hypothetical protein